MGGGRSRGFARLLKILRPVPPASATPRAASHCTMIQGVPDQAHAVGERAFRIPLTPPHPYPGQSLVRKDTILFVLREIASCRSFILSFGFWVFF